MTAKFTFLPLADIHKAQTIDVMTRAFCDDEPMTLYLGVPYDAYRHFANQVVTKAIADKLSIVAIHEGNVVACAIVEDLASPVELNQLDEKFTPIFTLLEKLGDGFFKDKKIKPNHIAHLFITAVDEKYRHQGLSREVNLRASELAAQKKFDFVYCEFTNFLNEKGTLRYLNYDKMLVGSTIYRHFNMNNNRPFEHLVGFANAYLWATHPKADLQYESHGKAFTHKISHS